MNRLIPILRTSVMLSVMGHASLASAQTPAPPVPPLTKEQKEAAAAIEAPKTLTPPPVPGQLQGGTPVKPVEPPQAPVPTPAAPALDSSASKMQVLEAVTQQPALQEAPRVSVPSGTSSITSSTSTSRQFIVHGKVFETRSAMSSRCDEISEELRKVLNDREPWVLPVVVLLNTGEEAAKSKGPPISTAITELTHGGFHLQVTVNERPGLKTEDLRKQVVLALLAERVLRNHQQIARPEGRLLLPDWVLTGVLHAMDYKASARPSALFATIFRSGKIYGIEEIIAASPVEMDGLSRTIYETSCCALVLALVDQPNGAQHFNKFLNALGSDPRSERELLNLAFPNFAASASSLNKWWSLQLAALSKPGIAEPYTPAESLTAIQEAITLRYEAKPDEAPKNIKPRPFVIPAPLNVASSDPPHPTPSQSHVAHESAPKPTTKVKEAPPETDAADETSEEKSKPSLWRRMLFLGAADKTDETRPADEEPPSEMKKSEESEEKTGEKKPGFFGRLLGGGSEEKNAEEKTEETKPEKMAAAVETTPPSAEQEKPEVKAETAAEPEPGGTAEEKKPGFFGRLLGGGSEEKKPEKKKEEKKPENKAAPVEKAPPPAGKEKPEAKPEDESDKKPSILNPLKWFRGGKKTDEEKNAKDEQASATPGTGIDLARWIAPSVMDAWQWLTPEAPRPTIEPLFRRKPKPAEEAKPDAKKEEEPKKTASEPKAEPQKPSKPRTTNPNSKPASKPASPNGGPQTNNPNSKPVPAELVPPGPGAGAPAAKSGLVPVFLPLEEYEHIMKRPDRVQILNYNVASLRALELRVSTLFRPVITGYLAAVLDLQEGKTKDMDKRLAALHVFALVAYQKSIAVRDYLDWYEASESGRMSGKFDDFLDLPKIIQQELPPRTDPISKYLDAIDKEFTK